MNYRLPPNTTVYDLDGIPPVTPPTWVEFQNAEPDKADAFEAAFWVDLAADPERCAAFSEAMRTLRSEDGIPDVVATTAAEMRCFCRAKVREWAEANRDAARRAVQG